MDSQILRAFSAVARSGSFTAAARELHLSQPAISKRIATLESQLGAKLFDRAGRQVILTDAGTALLSRAGAALDALRDCETAVASLGNRVAGRLVLVTSHHVGLHHLPPVLKQFVRLYPDVSLDVRFLSSEKACDAVLTYNADIAVVTLPEQPAATLQTRTIWDDPMRIVIADTLLAGRSPRGSDLAAFLSETPAIFPETDTFTYQTILGQLETAGVQPDIWLHSNHLETIRMLVAVGLGWSVLPETLVTPDSADGESEFLEIELPGARFQRSLGIVTHSARTASVATNAFIDLLPAA